MLEKQVNKQAMLGNKRVRWVNISARLAMLATSGNISGKRGTSEQEKLVNNGGMPD